MGPSPSLPPSPQWNVTWQELGSRAAMVFPLSPFSAAAPSINGARRVQNDRKYPLSLPHIPSRAAPTHPESHAEVAPPTGNFSPSKNDRYCFLLAPPSLSNLPSFYVLHLDGGVYVYLPPSALPPPAVPLYRSPHSSHSVDSFNAVVRKRTLAETQRGAAARLEADSSGHTLLQGGVFRFG